MLRPALAMNRIKSIFTGLLLAVLLCHCGAPQPPQCRRVPAASRVPAPVLLATAADGWRTLADPARKRQWPAATASYNAATAKLFDQLRCAPGTWDERAAAIGTRIAAPDPRTFDPAILDALFPATAVGIGNLRTRQTTPGLGLPLVGWKKTAPLGTQRPPFTPPTGIPYLATATLDFTRPGAPAWRILKRWDVEDTRVGERSHTLAADWSAPNAFYWRMCDLDDLELANVLLPDRFSEEIGLFFLQPYDPEKIPLVLVHGLGSSPGTFKHTLNALAPEPWFRQHYQVWLFNYPTGNPWPYSAAKFREMMNLAIVRARSKGKSRNLEKMVIIGHSMGGLITHGSITDPGTTLYHARYSTPIDELRVSAARRRLIREELLYPPLKEARRAVFLATPHRGSPMADMRLAAWLSRLIRLPKTLTIELLDETIQTVSQISGGPAKPGTSIGTLSPADPITRALAGLPLPSGVACHSVIGDRGRGDSPESSDGVVPYWSSHIEPVASEKIVPTRHSVQDHAETDAEIRRILLLHLRPNTSP